MTAATVYRNTEEAGLGYTGETWDLENRRFRGTFDGQASGDLIASGFGLSGVAGGEVTVKVRRRASHRDAGSFVSDLRVRLASGGAFLPGDAARPEPWAAGEEEVAYAFAGAAGADLSTLAVALAVGYADTQGLVVDADVLEVSVEA